MAFIALLSTGLLTGAVYSTSVDVTVLGNSKARRVIAIKTHQATNVRMQRDVLVQCCLVKAFIIPLEKRIRGAFRFRGNLINTRKYLITHNH